MTPRKNIAAFLFLAAMAACLSGLRVPAARAQQAIAQDQAAAVILVYQRIGDDQYPSTSIREEQFLEHLQELRRGSYNVMPLPEIVAALKQGHKLPPYTVAITFDGAHRSVLERGIPPLLKQNMPFTVFVAPDALDGDQRQHMSADDLRRLARSKLATIGLHPGLYARFAHTPPEEIRRQVNNGRARLRALLNAEATLFAYPFGEYSTAYRDIVAGSGFDAAFGQQSAVAHAGSDPYALPRFSMTEAYGDIDRFRMAARALPLPVSGIAPSDPYLTGNARPAIGFTVDPALAEEMEKLACFASGQDKPRIEFMGGSRVEIRLAGSFEDERARLNCTMPGPTAEADEDGRWRWFGLLLTLAPAAADENSADAGDATAEDEEDVSRDVPGTGLRP